MINKWTAQLQHTGTTRIISLAQGIIILACDYQEVIQNLICNLFNAEEYGVVYTWIFAFRSITYNQHSLQSELYATGFCCKFISTIYNKKKKFRSNVFWYDVFPLFCKLMLAKSWNPSLYK